MTIERISKILKKGKNDYLICKGKTIGENMRRIRDCDTNNKRMSRKCIEEITMINEKRISSIEKDMAEPCITEALLICEALEVSFPKLFCGITLDEIQCDSRTGLNASAIKRLIQLNRYNPEWINILNTLLNDKEYFKVFFDIAKVIINNKRKDIDK